MTRGIKGVFPALCGLAMAMACGSDGPTGPTPAEIVLNVQAVTIKQLDSARIIPSVVDRTGQLIAGATVLFESGNPSVVAVSKVGVITSVGPAGTATVTVRSGKLANSVSVTVTPVAARVVISPNPGALKQLETLQLTTQLLDVTNTPIPGVSFTFLSSKSSVGVVSPSGLVTSIGPAGVFTVFAQGAGLLGSTSLTVTQVPTNIRVTREYSRLTVGRTLRLTATVLDAVNAAIANSPVAFASSNPDLATVSTDGLVTSVGGLGAVTIRVSAPGTNVTQDITIPIVALSSPTGDDVQLIPTPLIYALRAFPNDSVIGVSYFGTASVINVSTGSVRSFDIPPAYGVDVAPGRSRVYMAGADGNLYEYDTHTWTSRLLSLGGQLFDVVVDPSERFAYVGLANLGVSVVDLNQWREVARDTIVTTALHLAINADGTKLYVGGGAVVEIEIANGYAVHALPAMLAQAVVVSSDKRNVFGFAENGTIRKFDLTAFGIVATWTLETCGPWGAALNSDAQRIVVSCPNSRLVALLDAADGTIIKGVDATDARRVVMANAGRTALVGTRQGLLIIR